jgi:hypothetical protein
MPDYSDWAREISEGSEERRVGKLEGIIEQLKACEGDMDNKNGPHVLLVKEEGFMVVLVSLASDATTLGKLALRIIGKLARWLLLLQFPGLIDALAATPHEDEAVDTLSFLAAVKDETQQLAMATNTALVDMLVANVSLYKNACVALVHLCGFDYNRARLYEHPGFIAAVTDATHVPACAPAAVAILGNIAFSDSLKMPMMRNPLVLDALLRAAGRYIDVRYHMAAFNAIICLGLLSVKSENHALVRDDVRIMSALTTHMDHDAAKKSLVRLCYIGDFDLLWPRPALDLSLFCSRPFHHQLSLVKALIREHPEQLAIQDSSGSTPLVLAQAAPLPAPIIGLLSDCVAASTLTNFSLAHLVGYKRSQIPLVLVQRRTLMCCLVRLADMPAQLPGEDESGALNPRRAVKAYRVGGKDPWSVIGPFAF